MRPDGMAYTFGLQKGVQFHHEWGDFTAQDVEHSFRMTMQEGLHLGREPALQG